MPITHIFIFTILFLACNTKQVASSPKFPALLVFGDSTVDTGNNNYITSIAKADHSPYGEDFPGSIRTGRFSNGKLVPDLLVSLMGLKETLPPFLQPNLTDDDILTGVNFASAGTGTDDLTSRITTSLLLSEQMEKFMEYITRVKAIVGEQKAKEILNNAVVFVSVGANDFLFSFYDIPLRRIKYKDISIYQDLVLAGVHNFIKGLYAFGCRKFLIAGVPPIGCLPLQMSLGWKVAKGRRQCVESQNNDSVLYNWKLQNLLPQIEASLPGSKLAYADDHDIVMKFIRNPQKYGFKETRKGCCGTGLVEVAGACNKINAACKNRSEFLFWDAVHPTQAAYQLVAANIYNNIINKTLMT